LRFGAGFVGGPARLVPGGGPHIGVGARLFGRVLGQDRGGEDQSGHDDETDHGFASCDCSTAFLSERTYAAYPSSTRILAFTSCATSDFCTSPSWVRARVKVSSHRPASFASSAGRRRAYSSSSTLAASR